MPRRRAAAIGLMLLALSSAGAAALTLDAATLVRRPARTDTFVLRGRLTALPLHGATALVAALDRVALSVPLDAVRRKRNLVTYRDETAGARVKRLRIDLKRRRFLLAGDGWVLDGLPDPLTVRIGTDLATECRMVRLRDPRRGRANRRGVTRLVLAPHHGDDGPCDVLSPPQPSPVALRAGVATTVRIDVVATDAVDEGSVRLFRLDAGRDPAGAPLCTLTVNGDDPTRLACDVVLTEAAPGRVDLVVRGTAAGAPVSSTGFALPVVPAASAGDVATVTAAQAAVRAHWTTLAAERGDTRDARMALLRALRDVPGILSAALSPNGIDVVYRYTNGWMGTLVLNRLPEPAPAAAARPAAAPSRAAESAAVPPVPAAVFRTCGDDPDATVCCQPPDRRLPLLGRRVQIWDAGFFEPRGNDALVVKATIDALACMGFQVTAVTGTAADVASTAHWTDTETLVLSTHGGVDEYSRVMFATAERQTDAGFARYQEDLDAGFVQTADVPNYNTGETESIFAVNEAAVRYGGRTFPARAIVYASTCFSSYGTAADAFRSVGAGVYFGYDWKVNGLYTVSVAQQLFGALVPRFQAAGDAYDQVTPKVDPNPLTGRVPGNQFNTWLAVKQAAVFQQRGERRIAYVGQPEVTPKTSSLGPGESAQLTAMVEGAGSCELTYHWYSADDAGTLSGDTGTHDFETSTDTATYVADDDPESPGDDVGVELLAPDTNDAIGAACAAATVSPTTTTTTTTTTTLPGCGAGVVESAEILRERLVGAQAESMGTTAAQPDTEPQHSFGVVPTDTDTKTWDKHAAAGGAAGNSAGSLTYTVAPCAISATGHFTESSTGGSATANAATSLDATLQITFHLSRYATYHLSGFVQASGTPKDGDATVFFVRCSSHFGTAEVALSNPTGQPVPFEEDGALYPYPADEGLITCRVRRGGASAEGTGDDSGTVDWSFTWTFD